jgi:hypothetical protein
MDLHDLLGYASLPVYRQRGGSGAGTDGLCNSLIDLNAGMADAAMLLQEQVGKVDVE